MSEQNIQWSRTRVFDLSDWINWLSKMATSLFGLTAVEFEDAFRRGELNTPSARDLGSILPILDKLRSAQAKKS